jgi:hypothetical protein
LIKGGLIKSGITMPAMVVSGSMVLVAGMGLGNRRRE